LLSAADAVWCVYKMNLAAICVWFGLFVGCVCCLVKWSLLVLTVDLKDYFALDYWVVNINYTALHISIVMSSCKCRRHAMFMPISAMLDVWLELSSANTVNLPKNGLHSRRYTVFRWGLFYWHTLYYCANSVLCFLSTNFSLIIVVMVRYIGLVILI